GARWNRLVALVDDRDQRAGERRFGQTVVYRAANCAASLRLRGRGRADDGGADGGNEGCKAHAWNHDAPGRQRRVGLRRAYPACQEGFLIVCLQEPYRSIALAIVCSCMLLVPS